MGASIFGKEPAVQVNYVEHDGQKEISKVLSANFCSLSPASLVIIAASRGWGKTLYLCCSLLAPFLDQNPNKSVMWVAPSYLVAMTPVEDVFRGFNEETGERYIPEFDQEGNRVWSFSNPASGPTLKWWNGATVVFRSADSPDSIVSKGFNLIIIDEAAIIQERVFTQQIMGTARKAGVKIFMITSPRGKKHFTHRIFLRGQDKADTDVLSFQQPFWKNPYFSPILKRLMSMLPAWLKAQEYDAEFVDDGDSIFKNIDSILHGPEIAFDSAQQDWSKPVTDCKIETFTGVIDRKAKDRTFVVGLDLAKSIDFTVFTVIDMETGELMLYKRINKEDYRNVLQMAESICNTYNQADLIYDATGVGAGLGDMLSNYNVTATPFVFTNDSKVEIVNTLILSIEHQELSLPNIQEIRKELSAFTYTLTKTGKISYNAPPGFHDDIVASLAMANWFRKNNAGLDTVEVLEDIIKYNMGGLSRNRDIHDEMENDND